MVLGPYLYKLYDLAIHSEFELPDLSVLDADAAVASGFPIVEIVSGKVPESLPNAVNFGWIEANSGSCIFHIRNKCRLQVINGNQVVVEALPGVTKQEICAYIIGCAFPTLAHMRKLIPLHVSMVGSPFGALMFTGPSGAGKSTSAAILAQQPGWKLYCDDICVLQTSTEGGTIHFGINKIKLWKNTIVELGLDSLQMEQDHVRPEKYHLPINSKSSIKSSEVSTVFKISLSDTPSNFAINKSVIFETIMNSIHAPFLVSIFNDIKIIRDSIVGVSSNLSGYEIKRTHSQVRIKEFPRIVTGIIKKELAIKPTLLK